MRLDCRRCNESERQEQGDHAERHRCEHAAVHHHHCDVDHRKHCIERQGEETASEETANIAQFGQARLEFPHRTPIKVTLRKPKQMLDYLRTESDIDPIRGVCKEVGAHRT